GGLHRGRRFAFGDLWNLWNLWLIKRQAAARLGITEFLDVRPGGLACSSGRIGVIPGMRKFFARNIDRRGRIVRGVWGLALIGSGLALWRSAGWICLALI